MLIVVSVGGLGSIWGVVLGALRVEFGEFCVSAADSAHLVGEFAAGGELLFRGVAPGASVRAP